MTLAERLERCLASGNLTIADLSRWFARPHPTVRGWLANGFNPRGGPHDIDYVFVMLTALESLIRKGTVLPLQRGISRAARIKHIERLRRDTNHRLSQKSASR